MDGRQQALAWYEAALAACDPARLLRECLPASSRLDGYRQVGVFAFGKAAWGMLAAWLEAAPGLGLRPGAAAAWISSPAGAPRLEYNGPVPIHAFTGGHPEPNTASLAAAEAMLQAARGLALGPVPALLVALVSGGGSALAEAPLQGGLEQVQRLHRALVASGAPIGDINLIRKRLSAFKGGRLAAAAWPQVEQQTWILSDVGGDDLAAVASGPTLPDPSTTEEFSAAWRRWLPDWPLPLVEEAPPPEAFAHACWQAIGSNHDLTAAVAELATAAGHAPVELDARADEWEEPEAAAYLAERWRGLRACHARPVLIAGGEVRVRLPRHHGRGGRNQLLALRLATLLAGEGFTFLSAGSDGVDGSSDAAGAMVDGTTVVRARALGFDPARHLAGFDPHPLLAATGDLIVTGPTGNNLRDLRLLLTP